MQMLLRHRWTQMNTDKKQLADWANSRRDIRLSWLCENLRHPRTRFCFDLSVFICVHLWRLPVLNTQIRARLRALVVGRWADQSVVGALLEHMGRPAGGARHHEDRRKERRRDAQQMKRAG